MTASDVLLDTWAWWEILHATPTGHRLRRRYLHRPRVRVHTSVLTLGEIAAKLATDGAKERIPLVAASLRAGSRMHDVTPDLAQAAGTLRAELRRRAPSASLVDAIILATSRRLGAKMVSADEAFRGRRDVVRL